MQQYFDSQPRKGADTDLIFVLVPIPCISTHSPARGLTWRKTEDRIFSHFNSQPRKGADYFLPHPSSNLGISTHSPARGLTILQTRENAITYISTHSPARG
mgnify:CR=1 FL=1